MRKKMTMEELATKYHNRDTAPRIVGGKEIPYIEHPMAVVKRLVSWGCSNDMEKDGGQTLDIAWGHDLLEDTKIAPEEIAATAGDNVLHSIEILSNLPGKHADKAAYIQYVAEHANTVTLLVKLADRLCNVEDFLVSEGVEKARQYFEKAEPIFQRLWETKKKLERGIEEDKRSNFPEDDDRGIGAILSRIISEVNSIGKTLGAHWTWDKSSDVND